MFWTLIELKHLQVSRRIDAIDRGVKRILFALAALAMNSTHVGFIKLLIKRQ